MKLNNKGAIVLSSFWIGFWCMSIVATSIGHFGMYKTGLGGIKDGVKGKLYVEGREYPTCDFGGAHVCNISDLAMKNYKE